jgi:hypothetical protein
MREHLEEFLTGERNDPPVDDKGKEITSEKVLGNPTLLPELLKCHIIDNWNSFSLGGKKCVFLCKIKGVQCPAGKCPACLKSCNYVWDVPHHGEAKAYFEMERMRQNTLDDQRAGYNNVLDRAFRHGRNYDGEQFVEQLTELRDQGEVAARFEIPEKFRSKFRFRAIFRDFWSRSRRNHFLGIAFFPDFFN